MKKSKNYIREKLKKARGKNGEKEGKEDRRRGMKEME